MICITFMYHHKKIKGKEEKDYNKAEWNKVGLHEVAMNILYCAISENDFSRICTFTNSKPI